MRLIIFFTMTFSLSFINCDIQNQSFEKKIVSEIVKCKKIDKCKIKVKNITDFEWDSMHVFKYNATFDDVKKVIGSNPKKYTEFSRKIIFTLKNDVVYFEELPEDVSRLKENQIVFDIPDNMTSKTYFKDNSIFNVYKEEIIDGKYFFQLKLLSSNN